MSPPCTRKPQENCSKSNQCGAGLGQSHAIFFFDTFEYRRTANAGKLQGNILEVPQSFSKMGRLSSKGLGQKRELFKQVESC